jgi:hypothetical protein
VSEPCHPTLRSLNAGVCPLCDAAPDPLAAELAVLDEEEARARKELAELDRDAALLSLAEFVKQGWHVLEPVELEWNWHHDALCANIQGMLDEWLRIRELRETLRAKRERQIWKQRWQKLDRQHLPELRSSRASSWCSPWPGCGCAAPRWTVLCVSDEPRERPA